MKHFWNAFEKRSGVMSPPRLTTGGARGMFSKAPGSVPWKPKGTSAEALKPVTRAMPGPDLLGAARKVVSPLRYRP